MRSCALLVVLTLITACPEARRRVDAGLADAVVLETRAVSTSDAPQRVTADDGRVTLIVPGGLLRQATTVEIRRPAGLPPGLKEVAPLAAYEISLAGVDRAAGEPFVLEVAYDPRALPSDAEPGRRLAMRTYDPERARWVQVPSEVDAARGVVRVRTDHLSLWVVVAFVWPDWTFECEGVAFRIFTRDDGDDASSAEDARVVRVKAALETATRTYRRAGFRLPRHQDVVLDPDLNDALRGSVLGVIWLPETSPSQPVAAAHELFHAVQAEYLSAREMARRRTWIEMTAEFAAGSALGLGEIARLDPGWPGVALSAEDDEHAYQAANLLGYLASRAGFRFREAWEASVAPEALAAVEARAADLERGGGLRAGAAGEGALLARTRAEARARSTAYLEDALGGPGRLLQLYAGFLAHAYLEEPCFAACLGLEANASTKLGMELAETDGRPFDGAWRELRQLAVGADYAGLLWDVDAGVRRPGWAAADLGAHRMLRVVADGGLPDGVAVSLYVRDAEQPRRPGPALPLQQLGAGAVRSEPVRVGSGESLFVVVVNGGAEPRQVPLRVEDERGAPRRRVAVPGTPYATAVPDWLVVDGAADGSLTMRSVIPPDWAMVRVGVEPSGATADSLARRFEAASAQVEGGRFAGLTEVAREPVSRGEARGLLVLYRARRRVDHPQGGLRTDGGALLRLKPGASREVEAEVQALFVAGDAHGLTAAAYAAPVDRAEMRGLLLGLIAPDGGAPPQAGGTPGQSPDPGPGACLRPRPFEVTVGELRQDGGAHAPRRISGTWRGPAWATKEPRDRWPEPSQPLHAAANAFQLELEVDAAGEGTLRLTLRRGACAFRSAALAMAPVEGGGALWTTPRPGAQGFTVADPTVSLRGAFDPDEGPIQVPRITVR